MSVNTKKSIIEAARNEAGVRPVELVRNLGLSRAIIHRHIKDLVRLGEIKRYGSSPHVFYKAVSRAKKTAPSIELDKIREESLKRHFCYFTPSGKEINGVSAFLDFLARTKQDHNPKDRVDEYLQIVSKAEQFRENSGVIDGLSRLKEIFPEVFLEAMYYSDFYSLPKYGKTKLGHYLLHGKSGQSRSLIEKVYRLTKDHIAYIIKKYRIESVAFVPHSIPRALPFLKEYRALLNLDLPEIRIVKAFSGDVPIAQKSLSKLEERIENARETIVVFDQRLKYSSVLVIDDAVGSGATMNEIARKLRSQASNVIGYAVVGSYKGFEVLKEV